VKPTVVGGDYGDVEKQGGHFPKRVRILVEGEVTHWKEDGSNRPLIRDVTGYLEIDENGNVTCDLSSIQ